MRRQLPWERRLQGLKPCYWKSSLNIAQPEAGRSRDPRETVRLLLNTFPRPAKAKLMRVKMMSFFMLVISYEGSPGRPAAIPGIPELPFSPGIRCAGFDTRT